MVLISTYSDEFILYVRAKIHWSCVSSFQMFLQNRVVFGLKTQQGPLSSSSPLRAIFCFPQKMMAFVLLTSIFLWILWLFMNTSRMGSTYLHLLNSGPYGSSSSLYKNCVWKSNYFWGAADGLELTISRLSVFNVTHCTFPMLKIINNYIFIASWLSICVSFDLSMFVSAQ